ncbi:MAG: toll/interleukin-1 receptor domain-containing protein [Anaerolineae bacterium]|jgi:hypothetical protein|nr:toll/interleukin-1 receptor domain-containing protein [Anaerolineae bacterium]
MHQIFVSYTQSDEDFTIQLANDLRASGARIWLDIHDAEPGRYWSRSIERALGESVMMLVVLSPAALMTEHVAVEWQAYLAARRPVIPVVAQPCKLPDPLRARSPVNFTHDYQRAVHRLTTRLIECGARARRVDPVVWSMAEEVHDYRYVHQPPPPPDPPDSAVRRVRQLVDSLRVRLRQWGHSA